MVLIAADYSCYSLVGKNVKPLAASRGQGLRLFAFSTTSCGFHVTPLFWSALQWLFTSNYLFVQHVSAASGCSVRQVTVTRPSAIICTCFTPKGSHPNWVQSSERQQPAKDVSSWADIWCLLRFKVTLQLPGAGLYQQQQHELIKWISVIPGSQDAYKHQGPVQTTTQSWRFYLFD